VKQNGGRTRAMLGHATSEVGTLFGHYRALMSETEARRISRLTPAAVLENAADKIIGMSLAAATAGQRQNRNSHAGWNQNSFSLDATSMQEKRARFVLSFSRSRLYPQTERGE